MAGLGLPATAGDYFRRRVPWNLTSGSSNDAPNGQSATFYSEISAWCLTCHTRYLSAGWDVETPDAIYKYRHTSNATSRNCITCHVAHGSNAQMPGFESANMEYPGGATAPVGNSRLLKVDNRGTCQLCHDPTGTIVAGQEVGPVPNPLAPLATLKRVVAGEATPGHSQPSTGRSRAGELPSRALDVSSAQLPPTPRCRTDRVNGLHG